MKLGVLSKILLALGSVSIVKGGALVYDIAKHVENSGAAARSDFNTGRMVAADVMREASSYTESKNDSVADDTQGSSTNIKKGIRAAINSPKTSESSSSDQGISRANVDSQNGSQIESKKVDKNGEALSDASRLGLVDGQTNSINNSTNVASIGTGGDYNKVIVYGKVVDQNLDANELATLDTLRQRRDELNKQGDDHDLKEGALRMLEAKLSQKAQEISQMQQKLNDLIKQYDKKGDERLMGLVKIYENMKPKDAARIFNELDLERLLKIVLNMKGTKVAPIIALMDPMKAKDLSVAFTQAHAQESSEAEIMSLVQGGD